MPLGAIRVRTLSTGGAHPLTTAADPIYSFESVDQTGDFSLDVYNDLFAFVSNAIDRYILVLNWKTGDLVAKIASLLSLGRLRSQLTTYSYLQPSSGQTYSCSFLDNSNIIFPYSVSDRIFDRSTYLRVVTLPNTADLNDAPSHPYHFALDIPVHGDMDSHSLQLHHMYANTLPTNPSAFDFPGLFHGDPGCRVLALEIETIIMRDDSLPFSMLHVLCIPHNALLSHISKHRSDTETVVIPWQDWVPGNAHLFEVPYPSPLRYRTSDIACGMHALTTPPIIAKQGNSGTLRVTDYHPRRIARLLATQGTCNPSTSRVGTATEESIWPNTGAEPRFGTGMSSNVEIPYVIKDIPLPYGCFAENMLCVLGEDVVVLFEVGNPPRECSAMPLTPCQCSLGNDGGSTHRVERVFYHPI